MRELIQAIFRGTAEIFFISRPSFGVFVLLVTAVADPAMAAAGLLCVGSAYGLARLMKRERYFHELGAYVYNPLLVGLALGHLLQLTPASLLLIVLAGGATFLTTAMFSHLFWNLLRLPALSVPFVVVASLCYVATLRYVNLPAAVHEIPPWMLWDFGLPWWLADYFQAMGAILFVPSVLTGIALCLALLWYSRILLLLSAVGFLAGSLLRGVLLGSAALSVGDLNNFNFVFLAMAIGGVFLVPSLTSYLLAVAGVAATVLFLDAATHLLAGSGVLVFTLPFNVGCLVMLYVLGQIRHPRMAGVIGRIPEETLGQHLTNRLRYAGQDRTLQLPFSGLWTVWQGVDGQWTHKGKWRYAFDFVITDEAGRTHSGEGRRLSDYYCFKKPVLAPVSGRVVHLIDHLPDSPPGSTDETNHWGNLLIIQDARGFFVELSHFAEKSIRVKVGDHVEAGTVLGLCGNSGYSPQPHIHIQAQIADTVGAATLPFLFISYLQGDEFHVNGLPPEKQKVEPLFVEKRLDNLMSFVLDEEIRFRRTRGGKPAGEHALVVRMASDGSFFFETPRGKLYFSKYEGAFCFHRMEGNDPALKCLFMSLPRLPLAARLNMSWRDYVPASLVVSGWRKILLELLVSFHPTLALAQVSLCFTGDTRIETTVQPGFLRPRIQATVELHRQKGFESITVGDLRLERIETKSAP